jgi:large subunit ribosomal protein L24
MQRLKVGDLVQVISGKDKGKQGQITKILRDAPGDPAEKVVVEGVNVVTKHQKPNPRAPQGGKTTKEAPIHASKVMPIDPETKKPTRVSIKVAEDGKKTRVAKSGAALGAG